MWEEKATICTDATENTWLYHEIGRAYLAANKPEPALAAGLKSRQHAKDSNDATWQLNATLLIAQANGGKEWREERTLIRGLPPPFP